MRPTPQMVRMYRENEGRRPGPPPWSGPPSVARALAALYTTMTPQTVQRLREEISLIVEAQVSGGQVTDIPESVARQRLDSSWGHGEGTAARWTGRGDVFGT